MEILVAMALTFLIPSVLLIGIGIWIIQKRKEAVYQVLGGIAVFLGGGWLFTLVVSLPNLSLIE